MANGHKKSSRRVRTTTTAKGKSVSTVYSILAVLSRERSRRTIKRMLLAIFLAGIGLIVSAIWQIEEFVVIPFAAYIRVLLTAVFGSVLTVIGSIGFEMKIQGGER